ncbi:MAG: phosphoribosylanthranilate isomerase [Chlorobiales bacterium]|jgi:phosphoribosylanthranilate isomerase|nr:phosphoribosylanthranilate isomerase [Chlorobiales bacterium]
MTGFIQVAGVHDWDEATLLIEAGVPYVGFPLRLPVHREDLSEEAAAEIVRRMPPSVKPVLITYLDSAEAAFSFSEKLGVRFLQLHGEISREELKILKQLSPELFIIKSLVIRRDNLSELEETVKSLGVFVDAFITDTYDPETGASGATGKTHDWGVSQRLVQLSPKPVILAGGLTPENVREAILAVRPAGVDVHTGVEGNGGHKDPELVRKFIKEAQKGFAEIIAYPDKTRTVS